MPGSRTRASVACPRNGAPPTSRVKPTCANRSSAWWTPDLRLNELRSASELHDFLIDEATELSGAERVLLVLETPDGLELAGSLVPRGEDARALKRDIKPALTEVRRTRTVSLTHSPEGADELEQRSRIIAPLIAQRQILGYLYADLDGAFGRFRESDRDLLGMLASQAAVALDNAQWSQGLEQKVAQRTEELQASNAVIEQRANELAIINSIQDGMAAELNFQAIVDLVGDKLREVFATPDLTIIWHDEKSNLLHYLYVYEHGKRLNIAPQPPRAGGSFETIVRTRAPDVINTSDHAELRLLTIPGTDTSKSMIDVPIISGDRVLGSISMENYERENAFGESEVRLLSTVAASMGVALENARLFDETQRLLKETEQRAGELAIINSVQEGLASKLDMQAIYELVGDKLSEVLKTQDIDIRLYDAASNQVFFCYLKDRGRRITAPPVPLKGVAKFVIESGQPWIVNRDMERRMAEVGSTNVPGTQMEKSFVAVPIVSGNRTIGLVGVGRLRTGRRLRRVERPPAADGGRSDERGARKRPPLRRDAAPTEGNRAARG